MAGQCSFHLTAQPVKVSRGLAALQAMSVAIEVFCLKETKNASESVYLQQMETRTESGAQDFAVATV